MAASIGMGCGEVGCRSAAGDIAEDKTTVSRLELCLWIPVRCPLFEARLVDTNRYGSTRFNAADEPMCSAWLLKYLNEPTPIRGRLKLEIRLVLWRYACGETHIACLGQVAIGR